MPQHKGHNVVDFPIRENGVVALLGPKQLTPVIVFHAAQRLGAASPWERETAVNPWEREAVVNSWEPKQSPIKQWIGPLFKAVPVPC